MRKGDVTKKVKIRTEEVAKLLRSRGCIMTRAVTELGFSDTQAKVALKRLVESGRAVYVKLGRVAVWCNSRRSAIRHIGRLRRALHVLLCEAKVKYVTPKEALELITGNKAARKLFSRYIELRPNNVATLSFLSGLLASAYGSPAFVLNRGREPLYYVDCRRQRLPPLRLFGEEKKQYRSVLVKVDTWLREAVEGAATATGVSISAVVRHAVEQLLQQYKEPSFEKEAEAVT